jgi:hypothetical protein
MGRSNRTRSVLDSVNVAGIMGAHLSAAEFDYLIVQHGNSGEFRRAQACPCVRLETRTADVSCSACKGLGRYYPDEMREPLIVLDVQRNETRRLAAAGQLPSGTISLTFPSEIVPGFGDLWLPDEEEHVVTETLWSQGTMRATDDALRIDRVGQDQIKPSLLPRKERLLYPSICCVENVAYKAESGDILTASEHQYHIDTDGRWTWRAGCGPSPGRAWTVRYRAPAAYMVHTSSPVYRSEADERMPHKCNAQALNRISAEDLRQ